MIGPYERLTLSQQVQLQSDRLVSVRVYPSRPLIAPDVCLQHKVNRTQGLSYNMLMVRERQEHKPCIVYNHYGTASQHRLVMPVDNTAGIWQIRIVNLNPEQSDSSLISSLASAANIT